MDTLTLATAIKNLWYKTSDIIWKYLEMEGKKNAAHFFIRIICRGSQTFFFFG
jgi:hypothetical protein